MSPLLDYYDALCRSAELDLVASTGDEELILCESVYMTADDALCTPGESILTL